MKSKIILFSICFVLALKTTCSGQNNISFQIVDKDFSIWAYKQHNEICGLIYQQIKNGKLSSYNVKNTKESTKESISKLATKKTVFIQTDNKDPEIGKDSVILDEASENYFFFKTSSEYLLLKPFKNSNNLLKFNKSELFSILNEQQKEYFLLYTSNYMLCIDSIPVLSERLFNNFNSRLFEYSKLPTTILYTNDTLNLSWSIQEKESMSQDQLSAFLSTDPDDPTIGVDTIIAFEYDIRDTNKQQAMIVRGDFRNFCLKINTISCGLERKLMGYLVFVQPYGYLPYNEMMPFKPNEKQLLNAVIEIKMIDSLNQFRNEEERYDDYFKIYD